MAGSPGAGKTTVARKLFSGMGLRMLNVDTFHAYYTKQGKPIDYAHFFKLTDKQKQLYVQGRMGLLIDGTARRIDITKQTKDEVEALGYETCMIFVNTDVDTCIERANKRAEVENRPIDEATIREYWSITQKNLGLLQSMFQGQFFLVDNSAQADLSYVGKAMRGFFSKPAHSPIARAWAQSQTKLTGSAG